MIILVEGISRSGKSTLANQLVKHFGLVETVKFPLYNDTKDHINYLYDQLHDLKNHTVEESSRLFRMIHNVFDYDFYKFGTFGHINPWGFEHWIIDRYFPSNVVYSRLHGIESPIYTSGRHPIKPDITIFLEVTDYDRYVRDWQDHENNTFSIARQLLTPAQLFYDGQIYYRYLFWKTLKRSQVGKVYTVEALTDHTLDDALSLIKNYGDKKKKEKNGDRIV